MQHVWGRGKLHATCWRGHLRERDRLEDPGVDGRKTVSWILSEMGRLGLD